MDVSASMSATGSEASPFEQMRAEARRIVEKLQTGEQAAIIAVDSTAHTACRLTGEKKALLSSARRVLAELIRFFSALYLEPNGLLVLILLWMRITMTD